MRVRQHRGHLRPFCRLEGLPIAIRSLVAVPGPRRIAEARAMGEQVANGNPVDRPVLVVHLAQLRNVADRRIVEREQAAIAQLQDGDGGHGLGDGGPVVRGFGIHGLAGFAPSLAEKELGRGSARVDNSQSAADHAVTGELGAEVRLERCELRARRLRNHPQCQKKSRQNAATRMHGSHDTGRSHGLVPGRPHQDRQHR